MLTNMILCFHCRCLLTDVLKKICIPLPPDIQQQIEQSLILPEDISHGCLLNSEHPPEIKLVDHSNINLLKELLASILRFIDPLSKDLPAVVFFHIHNCSLFFSYVSYYLHPSMADNVTDFAIKLASTGLEKEGKTERVAKAVSSAIFLLNRIIESSATLDEVMINNAIDLRLASSEVIVQHELTILSDFVSHGLSASGTIFNVSTHGLKCFMELQAIVSNIPVINDVLKQFGLHNCQKSEQYTLLKEKAKQMDSIGSMTLIQVKELLADVKENLQLKKSSDLSCFQLFKAVKRNVPFYRFADRMGFTGPNGRDSFRSKYRMVFDQLHHEQYNQAILHHLHGSYKYLSPFFNKDIEFEQLIEEILKLKNISEGVIHLEQVAGNIVMIKTWFENVEVS